MGEGCPWAQPHLLNFRNKGGGSLLRLFVLGKDMYSVKHRKLLLLHHRPTIDEMQALNALQAP